MAYFYHCGSNQWVGLRTDQSKVFNCNQCHNTFLSLLEQFSRSHLPIWKMLFRCSFGSECHSLGEFSSGKGLHTNGIEGFWAILKRSIIVSYHHVSTKYSQQYVNKCCFRQNNRFVDSFNKLLWQSVLVAWNLQGKIKKSYNI